jgi:hypothetical protein
MASEEDFRLCSSACHRLRSNSLYKLCSPFLIFMRIGGAFFLPTTATNCSPNEILTLSSEDSNDVKTIRKRRTRIEIFETLSKLYCFVVLICNLGYAGKFLFGFISTVPRLSRDFSGQDFAVTLSKFASLVWFVNIISVQLIFIRACWDKSLIYRLFMKWEDWHYNSRNDQCRSLSERFLLQRNIFVVLTVILVILSLLSVWLPALSTRSEFAALRDIFFEGFSRDNSLVTAVIVIGHFFSSFIHIIPVILYMLIGLVIEGEFRRFNVDLASQITEDGRLQNGSLEWFRLRHGKLCDFLELANKVLGLYG